MSVTGGGLSLTWGQAAFSAPAVDPPDLRAAPAWPAELDAGVGDAALYDRALAEHAAGRWAAALELLDAAIAANPRATRAHALAATVRAGVRELAPDLVCDWAAFPDVILAHRAAAGLSEPGRRRLRARRLREWLSGKTWFARSDRPDDLALAFSADGVASRAVIRFDADGRRYALVTYGTWRVQGPRVRAQWPEQETVYRVGPTGVIGPEEAWRPWGPDCEPTLDPWALPGPPPRAGEARGGGGGGG